MSRPPAAGAPAGAAWSAGRRPAVTSWFLLALTALAAFVGSGLETGVRGVPAAAPPAVDAASRAGAPGSSTDRPTDARVPFVGAVLGSTASPSGPALEPGTAGDTLLLDRPLGPAEREGSSAAWVARQVGGGSGRAPPTTTGT